MDDVELATLTRELRQDCDVAAGAFALAQERIREDTASGYEGCAHHLARLYNIIEQMGKRVAQRFENMISDDKRWHSALIERLSLDITSVRPALWPVSIQQPLHELRAFRHVFTHAYNLTLDPDKLRLVLKYAEQAVRAIEPLPDDFARKVAAMHKLTPPPNPREQPQG